MLAACLILGRESELRTLELLLELAVVVIVEAEEVAVAIVIVVVEEEAIRVWSRMCDVGYGGARSGGDRRVGGAV